MNHTIKSFTGLRFFMIMTVVICHFNFLEDIEPFANYFTNYWNYQILGVDYFFMLSGFGMMLGNIRRTPLNELKWPELKEGLVFGIKHIRKIYPTYIVTMAIGLVAFIIIGVYRDESITTITLKNIPRIVLSIPLLQSTTGIVAISASYNGAAWFLSTLFCIYLVSPWLIFTLRKTSKTFKSDYFYIAIETFFIIFLGFLFKQIEDYAITTDIAQEYNIDKFYLVYGSPYRRVFYVLMGMSLALLFYRIRSMGKNLSRMTANILETSVCIIAIFYYTMRGNSQSTYYLFAIDTTISAAFILIFAFERGRLSELLSKPLMQKLGFMSMFIYLIHFPIADFGAKLFEHYIGWSVSKALFFILIELVVTYIISNWLYNKSQNRKIGS